MFWGLSNPIYAMGCGGYPYGGYYGGCGYGANFLRYLMLFNPWLMGNLYRPVANYPTGAYPTAPMPSTQTTTPGISTTGDRDLLKASYTSLVQNLELSISRIDAYSKNVSAKQKEELEDFKQKIKELQRKVLEFGQNSRDKLITDALKEVGNLQGEYYSLEIQLNNFLKQIKLKPTGNPDETEPPEGVDEVEEPVEGVATIEGDIELDEIKEKYDSELKPELDEVLNSESISEKEKTEIEKKKKELEKAIEENKSTKEITDIYNDLCILINSALGKLEKEAKEEFESQKAEIIEKLTKDTQKYQEQLKEYEKYLRKDDKQKIQEFAEELEKTISNATMPEDIETINQAYEKFKLQCGNIIITAKGRFEEADNIAGTIYSEANGIDLNNSHEENIKKAVTRINKRNVRDVIVRWNNFYKAKVDDECILKTIYGEFSTHIPGISGDNKSTKEVLTRHILKAIEEYAKEKGVYNKISGHITCILSEFTKNNYSWLGGISYDKIYSTFNEICTIIENA